jgi:hypothetical protein
LSVRGRPSIQAKVSVNSVRKSSPHCLPNPSTSILTANCFLARYGLKRPSAMPYELILICRGRGAAAAALRAAGRLAPFSRKQYSISPVFDSDGASSESPSILGAELNSAWCTFGALPSVSRGERVKGIEPSCVAWKATVLPLNYTRGQEPMVRRRDGKGKEGAVRWRTSRACGRWRADSGPDAREESSGR